jgi:hypothetical protein
MAYIKRPTALSLSDPNKQKIQIRPLDLAILIQNILKGADHSEVGFEDPNHTVQSFVKQINEQVVNVDLRDLESALWSSNLLNEIGEWQHPFGKNFEKWLKDDILGPELRFDSFYNTIEFRKERRK